MSSLLRETLQCRYCMTHKPADSENFATSKGRVVPYCRACKRRQAIARNNQLRADPVTYWRKRDTDMRYRRSARGREVSKRHRVAADHKYRQKRAGHDKPFIWNHDEWQKTLDRFDHTCVYCGERDCELQQDHFIPLASADCPGTVPWNIVPSCARCNATKSGRRPDALYSDELLEPIVAMLIRVGDEHDGAPDDTPF